VVLKSITSTQHMSFHFPSFSILSFGLDTGTVRGTLLEIQRRDVRWFQHGVWSSEE
jgi:hypothetical protein